MLGRRDPMTDILVAESETLGQSPLSFQTRSICDAHLMYLLLSAPASKGFLISYGLAQREEQAGITTLSSDFHKMMVFSVQLSGELKAYLRALLSA